MKEKTNQEIALERIHKASQTGSIRLDLANLALTEIPRELFQLDSVRDLYLDRNRLTEIPEEICQLTNLSVLTLDDNFLTRIPEEVCKLTNLQILGLSRCKFTDFPLQVTPLTKLKELYIGENQITWLPQQIQELRSLISLILYGNPLKKFPVEISHMQSLKRLYLGYTGISIIPEEIVLLANLEVLNLVDNEINGLPNEITQLKRLQSLRLYNNNLSLLPQNIRELTQLERLEASQNSLSALPKGIQRLEKLKYLDLRNNPLPIPPEVLENIEEPRAILKYYFSLFNTDNSVGGYKVLKETKLLLVGQGSVGKTSIIRRLVDNDYDSTEVKTDGIAIKHWIVDCCAEFADQDSTIQLNIWDFGGQEIMHATHQFFLTKRSLYLLVLDSRLTQEENRVEYWLKIIQSFGGGSPVLIVGNKIDQHPLDIDYTGLRNKYPNIVGILKTSASEGTGIEELKTAIACQVNNLQHVRHLLPDAWFTVKNKLEELGRESNFITYDKYLDLCIENEIKDDTSQRALIGFLHDLGVVLHFQDDPRLEALGILNPQWVTNGVYKILNSHALFQNKGVLTGSTLDEILNFPEYPHGKHMFIVDMMKKFELCYDIEADNIFLVPDLLPKDEPVELKFNGIPAFEYTYPVLPSSIITRFIVRMNQHIHNGCVWRTGVLLQISENKALVKADIEDRKITIVIDGLEHTRRDALSAIRYQLDEIHASIKGLEPQKRVPVPNAPNAEPLKYEYLLKLERAGQETLLVEHGNDLLTVNVRQMLSAIEAEAQRKDSGGNVTNIYIGGNVEGSNIVSGNNNVVNQKIQNSFNKAEAADIQGELKETLKQLAMAVEAMNKALPEERAAEAADDLGKLVEEATKPKPNKKWYSVSIEGLIKAAENVEKVGEPVINLSRKVLSLLTLGAVQ